MTREEIQSLYLEVYKQQRLLGSLPGELELMEEVVSSFEDCQGWKEEEASGAIARPWLTDAQPTRSRTPGGKKGDLSGKELGHSERSPSKGTGSGGCPQGGDREIKLSPHPESARGKGKIKK